ncbi:hypothetical protein D9757_001634 [Collybiopsis confluens]|uniref:Uncharacterized protein n=1 Tax=Collybiopsis confluens TaxID=2823264 RepID=A0A8H5HYT5_9AGAR|nr:hypothetical protein D9757_001634 [Collybiopsis confluens]
MLNSKSANSAANVGALLASTPDIALHYISSDEDLPPSSPGSRKRPRSHNDLLSFNYEICAKYNLLCAKAHGDKFQLESGEPDLPLLREILRYIEGRKALLESSPTPLPFSTPRKTRKVKRMARVERSRDDENSCDETPPFKKTYGSGSGPASGLGTRKLSLYRPNHPPSSTSSPTTFDLLLQHEESLCLDSPRSPNSDASVPSKLTVIKPTFCPPQTSNTDLSRVFIISDDEAETDPETARKDLGRSDLYKRLIAYRRKASTALARLPEDILPLATIQRLDERPSADYKGLEKILAETSNIPECNVEERKAYTDVKLDECGAELISLCAEYSKPPHAQTSKKTISGTCEHIRRTVSVHQHTTTNRSINLDKPRYDG